MNSSRTFSFAARAKCIHPFAFIPILRVMSEIRGSTPSMSAGETFIRIVPSVLLFLMLVWCCCRGEQPNSTRAETPESRQERRRRIESALIIKKVIAAPHRNNGGMAQRLTTSDRAYSSFLSAVRLPSKEPVEFSESANDVSLQHAEEGGTCDSPHYNVHFCKSTHEGCDDIPTTDETTLHHDNEGAAAFQVLASSSTTREASLKTSNRTDVSWVPSASSSSISEQVATSSAVTSPPTLVRRKSNIIARTISMSLRSLNASSAPYTSCDICLMDYQVGEEVCWSPNEACIHAFHKDCMLDWLLRNPLCPVCRRDYLDVKPPEQAQQENETREA